MRLKPQYEAKRLKQQGDSSLPCVCSVCGGILEKDQKQCSLCGAVVQQEQSSRKADRLLIPRRLKLLLIFGVSALGVFFVFFSIVSVLNETRLPADVASDSQSPNLVTSGDKLSKNLGNYPGILSAGGFSCPWNDGLLLALNDGIYYHPQKELDKGDWQKVLDGSFACLNVDEDTLYALSLPNAQSNQKSQLNTSSVKGEKVVKVTLRPKGESRPETIYSASDALHPLTFLARQGDVLYSLSSDDQMKSSLIVINIKSAEHTGGKETTYPASVLHTFSSKDVRLFVTDNEIVAFHNVDAKSWGAEKSSDKGSSWGNFLSGSGTLSSACLLGNDLYYSIQEGSTPSTLRKRSVSGNFQDIQGAKKVVQIAGNTDALITKSSENQIGWLSPASNVWHSFDEKIDSSYAAELPSAHLGTFVYWAIINLGDKALLIDMNGKQETIEVRGS